MSDITERMKTYTGTKTIKAVPMTKAEYLEYRGWDLPDGEDPNEVIMLVEYEADPKSKPNHLDHKGYISMSPLHVFELAYKPSADWKERLQIEHDELGEKCDKLVSALADHTVPEEARDILSIQFNLMNAYLQILKLRLSS